jgi:flagellin-like protein
MKKLLRMHRSRKGITGLETAIILIAFVVVAAVFAYTVLSAGLFSTQKSQEAVYAGLDETQSTLNLRSSVVGYNSTLNDNVSIGKVEFTLALASQGGDAVDVTPPYALADGALVPSGLQPQLQIAYNDKNVVITEMPWTVSFIGKDDADYDLEEGEKAVITVWMHYFDGTDWHDGDPDEGFMGLEDSVRSPVHPGSQTGQGCCTEYSAHYPGFPGYSGRYALNLNNATGGEVNLPSCKKQKWACGGTGPPAEAERCGRIAS